MTEKPKIVNKKIAFALGGLAGNNAHGAGFLQAALESGRKPDLISCTSGQIYWVFNYLNELNLQQSETISLEATESVHLRSILEEDIQKTPSGPMGMVNLMLWGRPGKIEPDFVNYANEFVMNSWSLVLNNLAHPTEMNPISDLYHLLPSGWLVPKFTEEFYENISRSFNEERHIGIFFNSYNPVGGFETVYVNQAAKKALERGDGYADKQVHYMDITPQAVKDALRLYDYGFSDDVVQNVDGEYIRPIILKELLSVDQIFVVKPFNSKWIGKLPKTKPELEDMKTEIGINAIYKAEKANIELINALIAKGYLNDVKKYHTVTLHEVEVQSQEGFDEYAIENLSLFDSARDMGWELLSQVRK